jgi:hypothetical protein
MLRKKQSRTDGVPEGREKSGDTVDAEERGHALFGGRCPIKNAVPGLL